MAFSAVASHGPAALPTSWTVYALVACGAGNVLLTQTAYQAGRPMVTLPVIAAVTPVASVAVGIGLLGEAPRIGVAGGVAAGLAVLVTSLALARLAYSVPHPAIPGHGPTDRERHGLAGTACGSPVPVAARPATAGRRCPRPPDPRRPQQPATLPRAPKLEASHY
jgi:hypothetical protein